MFTGGRRPSTGTTLTWWIVCELGALQTMSVGVGPSSFAFGCVSRPPLRVPTAFTIDSLSANRASWSLAMFRIVAISICAGLLWGCAGENDEQSGMSAEPDNAGSEAGDLATAETFFSAFYEVVCNELVACREYETRDTCLSSTRALLSSLESSVTRGAMRFQPKGSKACLESFQRSIQCEASERSGVPEANDVACADVFVGTLGMGQRCLSNGECATDNCEVDVGQCVDACCAGVCGTQSAGTLGVGDSCSIDGEQCGRGKYCTASSVCAAYRDFGESCPGAQCFSPMVCEAAGNEAPTCRFPLLPKRGETCMAECDSMDDYCSAESRTCVARNELGQACVDNDECVGYASCVSGACVRILGMACDETANPCLHYRCVDGTCVEREAYACE